MQIIIKNMHMGLFFLICYNEISWERFHIPGYLKDIWILCWSHEIRQHSIAVSAQFFTYKAKILRSMSTSGMFKTEIRKQIWPHFSPRLHLVLCIGLFWIFMYFCSLMQWITQAVKFYWAICFLKHAEISQKKAGDKTKPIHPLQSLRWVVSVMI